jgi:hypothetical protein
MYYSGAMLVAAAGATLRGQGPATNAGSEDVMSEKELRQSPMMAHLLDALHEGNDIGHYGRLVFVMVARHFIDENACVRLLSKETDVSEEDAHALWQQVADRDYSPPRRDRVLAWQREQEFPICPNPDDPDSCNVYRELQFPDGVYDRIQEYHEEKAVAAHESTA